MLTELISLADNSDSMAIQRHNMKFNQRSRKDRKSWAKRFSFHPIMEMVSHGGPAAAAEAVLAVPVLPVPASSAARMTGNQIWA